MSRARTVGRAWPRWLAATLLVLVSGCAAPAGYHSLGYLERPGVYVVRRGDTLYSIAWRYDLDYRAVAAWNGIRRPYRIFPGERLRLTAPARRRSRPARRAGAPPPPAANARRAPRWRWPTAGRVVGAFGAGGAGGIDVRGRLGQPVDAAAAGRVVYAGSGLPGYGKLIIIKHNDNYLSAYGYNRRLLVGEGQRVRAGQPIAEMGAVGGQGPLLHFEIRRDGRPVDPLRLLPRR